MAEFKVQFDLVAAGFAEALTQFHNFIKGITNLAEKSPAQLGLKISAKSQKDVGKALANFSSKILTEAERASLGLSKLGLQYGKIIDDQTGKSQNLVSTLRQVTDESKLAISTLSKNLRAGSKSKFSVKDLGFTDPKTLAQKFISRVDAASRADVLGAAPKGAQKKLDNAKRQIAILQAQIAKNQQIQKLFGSSSDILKNQEDDLRDLTNKVDTAEKELNREKKRLDQIIKKRKGGFAKVPPALTQKLGKESAELDALNKKWQEVTVKIQLYEKALGTPAQIKAQDEVNKKVTKLNAELQKAVDLRNKLLAQKIKEEKTRGKAKPETERKLDNAEKTVADLAKQRADLSKEIDNLYAGRGTSKRIEELKTLRSQMEDYNKRLGEAKAKEYDLKKQAAREVKGGGLLSDQTSQSLQKARQEVEKLTKEGEKLQEKYRIKVEVPKQEYLANLKIQKDLSKELTVQQKYLNSIRSEIRKITDGSNQSAKVREKEARLAEAQANLDEHRAAIAKAREEQAQGTKATGGKGEEEFKNTITRQKLRLQDLENRKEAAERELRKAQNQRGRSTKITKEYNDIIRQTNDFAAAVERSKVVTKEDVDVIKQWQKFLSNVVKEEGKLIKQLETRAKKEGKSNDDAINAIKRRQKAFTDAAEYLNKVAKGAVRVNKEQATFIRSMQSSGDAVKALDDRIGIAIGKLIRYRVAFFVLRGSIEALRDSVRTFADVESGLAQLRKVLNPLSADLKELEKIGFSLARSYGKNVQEVIQTFLKWAQVGLDQNEVISATTAALKASNAIGAESTEVVEALTSAIFSYGVEAGRVTSVVDKWMAVQARFPVTAQDLMKSLQIIGIVAKDFNLTLDEFNGIVTAIQATTRKTGNVIANSLKTILGRLSRTENIKAFQDVGVAVVDTLGNFRPFFDVLSDLKVKWDEMTAVAQKNFALQVGGIRQYVDFTAVMNNFRTAQLAVAASMQSSGASTRANVIELKTFAAQLRIAGATMQEIKAALGEELTRPLQLALSLFNGLASIFINNKKALSGLLGLLGSWATITVAGIIIQKALHFVINTGRKRLLEYNNQLLLQVILSKQAGKAAAGLAAEQTALRFSTTALLGKWTLWITAVSAAISLLSALIIKTREYKVVAKESEEAVINQVESIFESIRGHRKEINTLKTLKDERAALVEAYEKATTEEGKIAARKALKEQILNSGLPSLESFVTQDLGEKKTEEELTRAFNSLIDAKTRDIAIENARYEAVRRTLPLQKEQLSAIRASIKLGSEKLASDIFFKASSGTLKFLNLLNAVEAKLDRKNILSGLKNTAEEFNTQLQIFFKEAFVKAPKEVGGSLSKTASDITNSMSVAILALEENFRDAIDAYNTFIDALREGGASGVLIEKILGTSNEETEETKKAIEGIIGRLKELRKEYDTPVSPSQNTLTERQKQLEEFLHTLRTGADQVGQFINVNLVSGTGNAIGELNKMEQAASELALRLDPSFADAEAAAAKFSKELKKGEATMLDLSDKEFATKFLKQWEKSVLPFDKITSDIKEKLSFEGVQKDALRVANELRNAYIKRLDDIKENLRNLDAETNEYARQIEKLNQEIANQPQAQEGADTETQLIKDRNEAQAHLNSLLEQRARLIALAAQEENITKEAIVEINGYIADLLVQEQQRKNALADIAAGYDSQIEFAQFLGKKEVDILRLEKERLNALHSEKVAQLDVIQDLNDRAELQAEMNDYMNELAKITKKISLAKMREEMDAINKLASSLQGALSSALADIPNVIIEGHKRRKELNRDLEEAQYELNKAQKEGDAAALDAAKRRIKEVQDELKRTKSFFYEIGTTLGKVFTGVSQAINQALADKFAQDLMGAAFGNLNLGQQIAKSILGVNTNFIAEYKSSNTQALTQNKIMLQNIGDYWKKKIIEGINEAFATDKSKETQSDLSGILQKYGDDILAASKEFGVDPNLIAAVIHQESRGRQFATSEKGAQGLMQLLPSTAKELNNDIALSSGQIYDSATNIRLGTKYLAQLLQKYNNDVRLALAAYNAGMGNVDAAGGVPNFAETVKYVADIIGKLERSGSIENAKITSAVETGNKESKNFVSVVAGSLGELLTSQDNQPRYINEGIKDALNTANLTFNSPQLEQLRRDVKDVRFAVNAGTKSGSDETSNLRQAFDSGLQLLAATLAATLGSAVGGGGPGATIGGQIGGLFGEAILKDLTKDIGGIFGTLGGPLGLIAGSLAGGFIGGIIDDLFGGPNEFVPAVEDNTRALISNTIAIQKLEKNVINAPSNFVLPERIPGGQGPQFNITVNTNDPDAFVEQVITRLTTDYGRGVRTGTTRRMAY